MVLAAATNTKETAHMTINFRHEQGRGEAVSKLIA